MMPFIIAACAIAIVAIAAWILWPKISPWVHDSETLFFARLQVAIAAVWGALIATNLAPVLSAFGYGKYAIAWVAFTGFATEFARRNRTTDM